MLLPDSMKKEYEQSSVLLFVFRQVKPALWKAPLARGFCKKGFGRRRHALQFEIWGPLNIQRSESRQASLAEKIFR